MQFIIWVGLKQDVEAFFVNLFVSGGGGAMDETKKFSRVGRVWAGHDLKIGEIWRIEICSIQGSIEWAFAIVFKLLLRDFDYSVILDATDESEAMNND